MSVYVLADVRGRIADFVEALITVYWIILIGYILFSLYAAYGGPVPYNRWLSAVIGFLRDVSEPYLAIFRRFIPPLGPMDVSPIVAILVLFVVGGVVAGAIRG